MTTLLFAELTIRETQRRKILWVSFLLGIGFLAIFGIGYHYIMVELEQYSARSTDVQVLSGLLLMSGLYAVDLLVILMAVLICMSFPKWVIQGWR